MENAIKKRKIEIDLKLYSSLSQDAAQLNIDEETIRLAKEYDPNTLYLLGMKYFTLKRNTIALSWLEKADQQNSANAQFQIGLMYKKGIGVQQNVEHAKAYFTKAANNGNVDAQNKLGEFCKYGIGTKQDYSSAVNWFTLAAQGGSKDGLFNLGQVYENGYGYVKKDLVKAFELYHNAAEMGHGDAKEFIAAFYRFGRGGVKVNLDKAVEWYERSAVQNSNVNAMYSLGIVYQKCYKDKQLAADWFKQSADGGHKLAKGTLKMLEKEGYYPRPIESRYELENPVDFNINNTYSSHQDDTKTADEKELNALLQVSQQEYTVQNTKTTASKPSHLNQKNNPSAHVSQIEQPSSSQSNQLTAKQKLHKQREKFKIMIQKLMDEPSIALAQETRILMKEIQDS